MPGKQVTTQSAPPGHTPAQLAARARYPADFLQEASQ